MRKDVINVKNRTIFENDNLFILRGIDDESIDLIYLDPPFNSKKQYSAPIGSEAAGAAFKDTWSLSDLDTAWHGELAERDPALYAAIHASELTHGKSMKSYLIMMSVRLLEMKRVLKSTGSIYLHCDPTASHYLKVVMDSVFGKQNFRNEVVWKRSSAHNDSKRYGKSHDILLYYVMGSDFIWNPQYESFTQEYVDKTYRYQDEHGSYKTIGLTGPGTSINKSGLPWRGFNPTEVNQTWAVPLIGNYAKYIESNFIPGYTQIKSIHARLDALDDAGLIHWPDGNKRPALKYYSSAFLGKPTQDIITTSSSKTISKEERTGFKTQKPLALLERIIKASSNEGDVVLDPFCGTGTTLVAAERLGREWVGIDLSPKAAQLVQLRLEKDLGLNERDGILGKVIHRTDIPRRSTALPNYRTHKHSLFGEQEGRCNGCQIAFPFQNMTVDHIVPQSKGGGDHKENLQLLCNHCNSVKNDDTQEELIVRLKEKGILKN